LNQRFKMQVAHDISDFQDGEERILVLKDSSILENEGNIRFCYLNFVIEYL
jgi:hypothetical protein